MASQPNNGCLTVLIAILMIGGVLWGIQSCHNAEESRRAGLTTRQREAEDCEKAKVRREFDAMHVAEELVTRFLKHPDDADFGWGPEVTSNSEGTGWQVDGKVKAKNDFGGTLTSRYSVVLVIENDMWLPLSCVIDGKTVFADEALADRLLVPSRTATQPGPTAQRSRETPVPTRCQPTMIGPVLPSDSASESVAAKPLPSRPSPRPAPVPDDPETRAKNLLALADNLAEAGKTEAALQRYQSILEKYPQTAAAAVAMERMGGMK